MQQGRRAWAVINRHHSQRLSIETNCHERLSTLESLVNRLSLRFRPHHTFLLQPFGRAHTQLSLQRLECALHAETWQGPTGCDRQKGEIETLGLLKQGMGQRMTARLFKTRCQLDGAGVIVTGHHRIHKRATQSERSGLVKDHPLNGRGLLDHIAASEQPALAGGKS